MRRRANKQTVCSWYAVAGAAMLCLVASPLVARPLDTVKEAGSLRVILYDDNKPFSWTKDDGKQIGIDVELANAIATELGVKADVVLRMPGEDLGDDLRGNVWRGPLTGGGTGDVMLHVPTDKELAEKNPKAIIGNSYFQETVALAIDGCRLLFDDVRGRRVDQQHLALCQRPRWRQGIHGWRDGGHPRR
jgi:polar amino acid transport system substrate-binding protein